MGLIVNPYRFAAAGGTNHFVGAKVYGSASSTDEVISLTDLKDEAGSNATLQEGDVVIVTVVLAAVASLESLTTPSGFSDAHPFIYSDDTNDTNFQVSYKVMGASPDTSFTLPGTGSSLRAHEVHVLALRGIDIAAPFDVTPVAAGGIDAGQPDPPAITPVTAGALITVHGGSVCADSAVPTAFANSDLSATTNHFLSDFFRSTGSGSRHAVCGVGMKEDWSSGSFDPAAWTGGHTFNGNSWAAASIAWRPSGGAAAGPIQVRGSRITHVNNANSLVFTLPASSAAGDHCIILVEHGFGVTTPAGWTNVNNLTGTNINGAAFEKVLSSGDISTGSVTISFAGTYYGAVAGISFIGAVRGIRDYGAFSRNSAGASSRALTTGAAPQTGDYAIYFGSTRASSTCTVNQGASLQTLTAANASACLYGGVLASDGAVSATFSYSTTGTGDYQGILVVIP
jgi:hypothetical protein